VLLVFLLEFVCFHNLDIALCVWLAFYYVYVCSLCLLVVLVFVVQKLSLYLFSSMRFVLCSSSCSFFKVRGCCCGALLCAHNLFCSLSLFLFMVVARVVCPTCWCLSCVVVFVVVLFMSSLVLLIELVLFPLFLAVLVDLVFVLCHMFLCSLFPCSLFLVSNSVFACCFFNFFFILCLCSLILGLKVLCVFFVWLLVVSVVILWC